MTSTRAGGSIRYVGVVFEAGACHSDLHISLEYLPRALNVEQDVRIDVDFQQAR